MVDLYRVGCQCSLFGWQSETWGALVIITRLVSVDCVVGWTLRLWSVQRCYWQHLPHRGILCSTLLVTLFTLVPYHALVAYRQDTSLSLIVISSLVAVRIDYLVTSFHANEYTFLLNL